MVLDVALAAAALATGRRRSTTVAATLVPLLDLQVRLDGIRVPLVVRPVSADDPACVAAHMSVVDVVVAACIKVRNVNIATEL